MSSINPCVAYGAADFVRLPLRVHPEADEPILSFVVRLAAANKYEHVYGLTAAAGLPTVYFDRLATQPVEMAGLAYSSRLTEGRLRYMQYLAVDDDQVNWLGRPVRRCLVHTKHRRWCPQCLQEEAYHRASWDLLPIGACHRHRCELASRCGDCGKAVGWLGKTVTTCRCGGDLRRAEVGAASEGAAEAVRSLLEGLGDDSGADRLWLATVLGWLASPGQMHQPTARTLWWRRDDRIRELEIGWRALQDWPNGFLRYLDCHFPERRELWPIVRWVERRYDGPLKAEMSEMLKEHSGALQRRRYLARQPSSPLHAAIAY